MFWVLVANAGEAKLLSMSSRFGQNLQVVKEFHHPESRQKGSDLASDRPGHQQSKGSGQGSLVEQSDPKSFEVERFAQQLGAELEAAFNTQQFEHLVVIAAAHFRGLLNQHFSQQVLNSVIRTISKDLTKADNGGLLEYLNKS